jgi:protein involved in polysaccharide export with SLBB domain
LNVADLTTALIPFNLGKAVLEGDPAQNLQLQPGDVITIFSKDDIQVQAARQSVFVKLEGELATAGVYQALPGETLRQLVTRIGGLTPNAYLYGAEFERESTRAHQQKRLEEATDKLEQEIQRSIANRSTLSRDDAEAAKVAGEGQLGLVARMRKVRATGRIVLELPSRQAQLRDLPDLRLEDGDRFFVPQRPSTVSVVGAVYNANAFIYRDQKRFNDYLTQSGGPTKDADASSLYLIRADGTVVSKRQSGFLLFSLERERMMPGDTIVVPENLDKYRLTKDIKDWSQILYQFGLAAAGIKVLKN